MTVPQEGVERLIHFVEKRMGQLDLTKDEVARRGGPSRDTLAKVRGNRERTPQVGTLLRLDQSLGWQPGSSAVVLLGGQPLSLNVRRRKPGPRRRPVKPVTDAEIAERLAAQLHDEIARLEGLRETLDTRISALRTVHGHFVAELTVDEDLIAQYDLDDDSSAVGAG
jgi:hypothetical protein